MARPETLAQLSASLRSVLIPGLRCRPFICDGSPFNADVAIVAINPGAPVPFWDYWDNDQGFNRQAWVDAFNAQPGASKKTTRRNLERLVRGLRPLRVVELNAYPYFTNMESGITAEMRDTRILHLMLEVVSPRGLLAFGREPTALLADLLGVAPPEFGSVTYASYLGRPVVLLAERHLSRGWSYAKLQEFVARVPTLLPNAA